MDLFSFLEKALTGLGMLTGLGISAAGEKMGNALPAVRPMDKIATARRMSRDQTELYNLYKKLLSYADQAEDTCSTVCWGAVLRAIDPTPNDLTNPFVLAANRFCQEVLHYERYFPLPEIDFTREMRLSEIWELTALTRRCLAFYGSENQQEKVVRLLDMFLYNLLHDHEKRPWLDEKLFRAVGEDVLFSATLESLHANIPQAIEAMGVVLGQACTLDGEPFPRLHKQFEDNFLLASGIDPHRPEHSHKEPIMPRQAKGKTPLELVYMYLNATPFPDFLTTDLPFAIPLETRFAHMHILGGSGHGKTQTVQNFLLSDLAKVGTGERSVIVMDSQGDLIHNILKLEAVGDILDRVVLIYPSDIDYPPALNLFDFGLDRLERYSKADQEKLVNGAVSLYEYVFGAILGADLTAKQGVIFGYLARLLLVVPGATIDTLLDFLQEPEAVRPYLGKLADPITRRFFQTQFFNNSFDDTRQQILYRIYDVLQTSTLARMFRNKRNKLNLFDAMDRGSLILIHTAKDLLKQDGCEILGRFFIALIAQAAQERAAIPKDERTPTFVYIDEAHDYFDENMEILLEQARKFQVGLILAHQHLAQFERKLQSTVMTNTAIKLVGGLSDEDARALAGNMRCTPEFLLGMKKHEAARITQFACWVRNHTPSAIRLNVPLGMMEAQPPIDKNVLATLFRVNREKYCAGTMDEYPPDEPASPEGDDSPLDDPNML
jgi:Type IV secretion-system coupling protein DNA-binding domain